MEHTFMMVLDHVGDQEAIVYAQLGQQPLVRTTATSLEPRRGTLSCLSARPPDLAFWTGTRPQVVSMFLSIVPFLYSKRTAAARSLVSRYRKANVLSPLRSDQPWTYPRLDMRLEQSSAIQHRLPQPGSRRSRGYATGERATRTAPLARVWRDGKIHHTPRSLL
jgi:hypothetical protein